jgi:protoporphyrinogen oxidase
VAERVKKLGGEIRMGTRAIKIKKQGNKVVGVVVETGGKTETLTADYVFSTTDVRNLINILEPSAPEEIRKISQALQYRDFLTVGLLLSERPREPSGAPLTDTWMYIHEKGVNAGRVQLFHNWHPKLVRNPEHGWVGLEYFCNEGDALWRMGDKELVTLGGDELGIIGLRQESKVLDGVVIRQRKAYPGYFGSYAEFPYVRNYLDTIPNLYPVGRNGMHRYNNQDHSMLAAMTAVDNIVEGRTDKANLWLVNAEEEYHEEKK